MTSHRFIEDNLVILSKQTIDAFLHSDRPDDLIALYVFYYYTAKWQKTNQIKAARSYVIKALKWGKERFTRTHKKLIELGLIEPFQQKDKSGKVQGHYVRIKYIWKQENLIFERKKPEALKPDSGKTGKKTRSPKNHPVENKATNALSVNSLNALSANRVLTSESFVDCWNSYDSLPDIRAFSKGRLDKLKARAKEDAFRNNWREIIRKLSTSPFHTGLNDRGWRADCDWILKNDTNYLKILELPDPMDGVTREADPDELDDLLGGTDG